MTRAERTLLRTLIDRAKRAQVEAQGGRGKIEADARGHDLTLRRLAAKPAPVQLPAPPLVADTPRDAANQRVDVDQARQLRRQGLSYPKIAARLGCGHHAVMWACDDYYRQRRLAQIRAHRLRRKAAA